MRIRPAEVADLDQVIEIDGAIESSRYLHVDRTGEGLTTSWRLEGRPLRARLIERNALDDDRRFVLKQVVTGVEEGIALAADHEGELIALGAAALRPDRAVLDVIDVRIDADYRRQGIGSAMLFQIIQEARTRRLRAVSARSTANNHPACQLLAKTGFDLAGVDTHFHSNYDLVKEAVTFFWYAVLE